MEAPVINTLAKKEKKAPGPVARLLYGIFVSNIALKLLSIVTACALWVIYVAIF